MGEELTVDLSGVGHLCLRPSLRCALELDRREGGFPKLIRDLQDHSLTATCAVLRAAGEDHPFLESKVLTTGLPRLSPGLLHLVLCCAGLDIEADDDPREAGQPIAFRRFLLDLYGKGTGWLGWTPEVTLDATPAEIILAVKGRVQLVNAIFGSEPAKAKQPADLAKRFRAVFGAFGTRKKDHDA
ncbi:hypothetical protein [Frigidibacter oleivorans]|uniref:hypothetical protein n=1 Tax=Frigidibacter oleivorans TaxID=2487129 RepID=UPI000F8E9350|nr:hypothetical protein [Frigidibacter oleivorans]